MKTHIQVIFYEAYNSNSIMRCAYTVPHPARNVIPTFHNFVQAISNADSLANHAPVAYMWLGRDAEAA